MNSAKLARFGAPVTYSALHGTAAPVTIQAIRGTRDALEDARQAALERIWTPASSFAAPPQTGDVITLGTEPTEYVVFNIKPDDDTTSDGLRLYLERRQAAPGA